MLGVVRRRLATEAEGDGQCRIRSSGLRVGNPCVAAGKIAAGGSGSLAGKPSRMHRGTSERESTRLPARVVQTWTRNGVSGATPIAGGPFTYAVAFKVRETRAYLTAGTPTCRVSFDRAGSHRTMPPKSVSFATVQTKPAFVCKLRDIPRALRGALLTVRLAVQDAATGRVVAVSTLSARVR